MRSDILFWSQKRTKILRLHCSASPSQDDRGDADPKPGALGGVGQGGQQKTKDKRVLRNFSSKPFLLHFCFLCCMKRKMSRVNVFECGCTQTLDKHFSFMQFRK